MENKPLVSVIVPCYNHQKYVRECLTSVLQQTYANVQLIVIDDGSVDESVEIIQSVQEKHQFIFVAQENIGLSATLNKAIKEYVKGSYVALLASDDFWHVDKLAQQVAYLNLHPEVGMVFSKAAIVDDQSVVVDRFGEDRFKEFCTFEDLILDKKGIPALTTVIKTDVFDAVGLFDEHLRIEDWDMWLRIADKYKIGYIAEELAYYRMHDSNISSKLELMMDDRIKILKKWQHKTDIYKKAMYYWQLFALRTFVLTDKRAARKFLNLTKEAYFSLKYYKLLFRFYFK